MSQADITRGLGELASSKEAYELAEGYYTGDVAEFFANSRIKSHLGDGGKGFRIPFSAIPVDARIDMIDIRRITAEEERLQPIVDAIVEANDLDVELIEVYRKAAYFGDMYVLAWLAPDEDGDGIDDRDQAPADDEGDLIDPALVDAAGRTVEVFLNSPLQFRVVYSSENAREPLFGIKVWEADNSDRGSDEASKKVWRVNLYYRDRVEQWVSVKGKGDTTKGTDFAPYLPDGVEVDPQDENPHHIENPYDAFPFFHFRQGGKPYGVPVHRRAYGPQDALTKLNATHMSTVDFIGYPQRYATRKDDGGSGMDGADEDFPDFEVGTRDSVSAKPVRSGSGESKLKAGPGEMWWLDGVDQVGQFATAGPEPFLEPIKFQIAAMARLTKTPADEFNTDQASTPPSGESRRRAHEALYRHVRSMERGYGAVTEALVEFCLLMLGYPDAKVTVQYAPLDSMSGLDDWQMIEAKLRNGVPLRTVLVEAGYSEEDVNEWYPDKAPALSLSQISVVGSAIQSLGAGVGLGAIDAGFIRRVLPELFDGVGATEPGPAPVVTPPEA